MTICGALSEPIRDRIREVAERAYKLSRPNIPITTVIEFTIDGEDMPHLRHVKKLYAAADAFFYPAVRLRDVGEDMKDFWLSFAGGYKPGFVIPDYAKESNPAPARGTLAAQERILPLVMKSYHLVSRVRVALHVFDQLDSIPIDLDIRHLRYHLEWLPALIRACVTKLEREYKNTGRSKRERLRRLRVKEQRDEARRWVDRLDDTSEKYHFSVPHTLRTMCQEASAAMATIKLLERVSSNQEKPAGTMVCNWRAPYFYNHTTGKLDVPDGWDF